MISEIILKYYSALREEEHQRYKSWEHCYKFFRNHREFSSEELKDHAALHLAFYLASWGMYRGSSFLLQKDYKVHRYAIDVLLNSKYDVLWDMDLSNTRMMDKYIELIFQLKEELINAYTQNIKYVNGEEMQVNITDTLCTKILLGTLGCIPAYDRYFVQALKIHEFKHLAFDKNSFYELVEFYNVFKSEFEDLKIKTRNDGLEYPAMKLMDMYFWQVGYLMDKPKNEIKEIRENILTYRNVVNDKGTPIVKESDLKRNKAYKIPVWKMVKEAVDHMGKKFTRDEIKKYIFEKYGEVNNGTIECQINVVSVNRSVRVNWAVNQKERVCNEKYDFIYDSGDGYLEKYDPDIHGLWEIRKVNGKYCAFCSENSGKMDL